MNTMVVRIIKQEKVKEIKKMNHRFFLFIYFPPEFLLTTHMIEIVTHHVINPSIVRLNIDILFSVTRYFF